VVWPFVGSVKTSSLRFQQKLIIAALKVFDLVIKEPNMTLAKDVYGTRRGK
jgi:hypothetical protein